MSDAPLILGVSGLRGIVGESLTPEVAVRYAGAFGTWLQERIEDRQPYVLVARDGRAGDEAIYTAVISGLLATGCRVRRLNVAMTPTVGMQCDFVRADAAMIVTASHNPQEWNGVKMLVRQASWTGPGADGRGIVEQSRSDACAPGSAMAAEIVERFNEGRVDWWSGPDCENTTVDEDVDDPHCLRVLDACGKAMGAEDHFFWEWFGERLSPRVVADSVNASGAWPVRVFFEGTPCQFINLHGGSSGVFPHTPEPTRENLSGEGGLCDAVPGLKADVGFAQDPDADRLAIVDELGNYIGEEYTLVLCAAALMEGRKERGATGDAKPVFVVNLSTSRMIDDVAAHYGAEVERTAVGEANVVERMKALTAAGRDVVMGGEGNGGVIWPRVVHVRDSLVGMALVLEMLAMVGRPLGEIVDGMPSYAIVKQKLDLTPENASIPGRLVEVLPAHFPGRAIDVQDGVRIDWPDRWVHVRASNTEPILRLIAEGPTEADCLAVLQEVRGAL
ncbi:MAG: hypothetical protein AAGA55_09560, partial [Planctomycetota bacterium]